MRCRGSPCSLSCYPWCWGKLRWSKRGRKRGRVDGFEFWNRHGSPCGPCGFGIVDQHNEFVRPYKHTITLLQLRATVGKPTIDQYTIATS
jgi:hypothetical protein